MAKGYYDVANTLAGAASQVAGAKPSDVPLPGHAEAMGRRENAFVKSRLDLFYQMHPEWDKRSKGENFPGNPHTPYLQNLNEALLSGNVQDARKVINKLRTEQKLAPQQLKTTLRESVGAHRPIPTGAAGQAFMRWAGRTLPTDELQRMHRIERVYETTAQRAGISLSLEASQYAPQ